MSQQKNQPQSPVTASAAAEADEVLVSPSDEQLVATIRNLAVILACRRNASSELSPHDRKQNERLAKIVHITNTMLVEQHEQEETRLARNHLLPGLHEAYNIFYGKPLDPSDDNWLGREGASMDHMTSLSAPPAKAAAQRICQAWAEFCVAAQRNDGHLSESKAQSLLPNPERHAIDARGPRAWAASRASHMLGGGKLGETHGRRFSDAWEKPIDVRGYFFRAFEQATSDGSGGAAPQHTVGTSQPSAAALDDAVELVVQETVGDLLRQAKHRLAYDTAPLEGESYKVQCRRVAQMIDTGWPLREVLRQQGELRPLVSEIAVGRAKT